MAKRIKQKKGFFLFRIFRKRKVFKQFHERGRKAAQKPVIEAKGRVKANLLNVRKKPDLNAKVVGQLRKNNIVDILNKWGDWYQIRWKKHGVAYLYARYVSVVREEKSGMIMANRLNVRSRPSLEAPILGILHKGDFVTVIKEYEDWLRINYKGKAAFIYKTYVKLDDIPLKQEFNPQYFHERKDLKNINLEPSKKFPLPAEYFEKIAVEIWNKFGGLLEKLSSELKIDIATAVSVLAVESRGKGFIDNRLLIRFENHVFWLFWGQYHENEFNKHFKFNRDRRRDGHYFREKTTGEWETCHTGQDMEWRVFEFAKKLDATSALKSISMGAPQVMGFNYKSIGYDTPQEMFEKFKKDIRYHIFALFDFCKAKPERIRYLQKHDFYNFAVEYNGNAAPKAYEERLLKFYRIFKKYV